MPTQITTRSRTPITTRSPSDRGRRRVLTCLAAGAAALALPGRGQALTTAEASNLINRLVTDINAVINSGKRESAMYQEFERIFGTYADVPLIAQMALGPDWRVASTPQRRAFAGAFQSYISRKYGQRFREFIGGEIRVTGTQPLKSFYEVISVADLRGEAPFEVRWHVRDSRGQPKMFNLFIEGVNMLATERTEVRAMLDRQGGNLDALIAELRRAG